MYNYIVPFHQRLILVKYMVQLLMVLSTIKLDKEYYKLYYILN